MTPDERAFLERARVGSLATVDAEGRPHAVPICFALLEPAASPADATGARRGDADGGDGRRIVSAIDEKPKATRDLRRVRNVRTNPRVTLLVDRYREDWSRLAWIQVRGRARILEPDGTTGDRPTGAIHDAAVRVLENRYDQYADQDHALDDRPIVSIRVTRVVSWGALESESGSDSEDASTTARASDRDGAEDA
ncbi:TIGR03668 family PPOX class F420-dependent oxidoreductase [Natrinema salaciae]|uniref:PPOX class probable F420-dependent enzyme, Rv0121 family n=1 Tax=Natrinema salaciae TaxID=1186196 RepID=A0A1H9MCB8_9EURY|nr:TIGR03668 family PPOX class F420-dependent oxidoreductase [Natrinema salaciae]SER21231.1 PPOX class probable F420-dependent enzyme, Rv0121 family [Natrinema salaciae]